VDVDEFIAAVEILRRPELRGRPVIVGGRGDPTKRGVVATANYEARHYGVNSGMPLRTAARRCPEAVFLATDRGAYEAASADVMNVLARFTDALEVWGWDEAFLEVHGEPERVARAIQTALTERTGLVCSVGIGDNKLRAKIATGFAKPAGVYRLTADNWFDIMADRPTEALWGIGKKTARRLAESGIGTVGDLARADEEQLAASLGPRTGPWLVALARGEALAGVSSVPHRAKSRGLELTFDENVEDSAVIFEEVERMARALGRELVEDGRPAVAVTLKLRFAPFVTRTRRVRLDRPTTDPEALAAAAARGLDHFELDRPVRLVGVKADLD
jgi:DNA polymerase-4